MEKRREKTKALTTLLTKIAGLVFMAFLAISVGVILAPFIMTGCGRTLDAGAKLE